jgi:hypothetical protein
MTTFEERRKSIRDGLEDHVTSPGSASMADYLAEFFAGEGVTKIEFADGDAEPADDDPATS